MPNAYTAFQPPEPVLEERNLNEVCEEFVRGHCKHKDNLSEPGVYHRPHEIYRIWDKAVSEETEPLPIQNCLSLAKLESRLRRPFDDKLSPSLPRHDNDYSSIVDIKIFPTTDEIICTKSPYMPLNDAQAENHLPHGYQRHLDMLFRHLRYDSITSFKTICLDAVQCAIQTGNPPESGRVDYRRKTVEGSSYSLFHNGRFQNVSWDEKHGAIFQVSYDCPPQFSREKMSTSGLFEGTCALIAVHRETREVNVIFCDVFLRQSTNAMNPQNGDATLSADHTRAAVRLSLTEGNDYQKVRQCCYYANKLYHNVDFHLVDLPGVLPAGFARHLERLKEMFVRGDFTFKEKLFPNSDFDPVIFGPPSVSDDFVWNLNGLRSNEKDIENFTVAPEILLKSTKILEDIKERTTLDEGQATALYESLTREMALTQGPPGTGKTYLGVQLLSVILDSRTQNEKIPVVVICMTNHAVDDFLSDVIKNGKFKVARLGSRSSPEHKQYSLRELGSSHKRSMQETILQGEIRDQSRSLGYHALELADAINSSHQPSWISLRDYLKLNVPEVYAHFIQLERLAGESDFRGVKRSGFAFNYWVEGGDLDDLQRLEDSFLTLLGPCESDEFYEEELLRMMKDSFAQVKRNAKEVRDSSLGNHLWNGLTLAERISCAQDWSKEANPWKAAESLAELHRRHGDLQRRRKQVFEKSDAIILMERNIDVIALTSTGFVQNYNLLASLGVHTLLVEEASELLEAHLLCALVPSLKHVIQIGDPRQLRPSIQQTALSLNHDMRYRMDESLFERLINLKVPYSKLWIQRRSHPDMANILRAGDYPYLIDHPSTLQRQPVKGIVPRLFWLDHTHPEDAIDPRKSSMHMSSSNEWEAEMVFRFVVYLITVQGYRFHEIAVLTGYKNQLALLFKKMKAKFPVTLTNDDKDALIKSEVLDDANFTRGVKMDVPLSGMLKLATLDSFQGEETNVVICSLVRSNSRGAAGFLKVTNRINVLVSRARDGFYIVGNSKTVRGIPHWDNIINVFKSKSAIQETIHACCPRHPDSRFLVSEPEHFSDSHECCAPCGEIFEPCRHTCESTCHPVEMHTDGRVICTTPVTRINPCGHSSTERCGVPGGPCMEKSSTEILNCGHVFRRPCFMNTDQVPVCNHVVQTDTLPCHHTKVRICSQEFTSTCAATCGRKLSCTHECPAICHGSEPCPPCEQPCKNRCEHRTCPLKCSQKCVLCIDMKKPTDCPHESPQHTLQSNTTICCLPRSILPCARPCRKLLACGLHSCPGLCGEVCGTCGECDDKFVNEPQITLECKHKFVVKMVDTNAGLKDIYSMTGGMIQACVLRNVPAPAKFTCPICFKGTSDAPRYELGHKLEKIKDTIDELYTRMSTAISGQFKDLRIGERQISTKFASFLDSFQTGPLRGSHNTSSIGGYLQFCIETGNNARRLRDREMIPIERSISSLCGMSNNYAFAVPSMWFQQRMHLVYLRTRLAVHGFASRLAAEIKRSGSSDLHSRALLNGIVAQASAECRLIVKSIDLRISFCETNKLKRLEAEFRLLQVSFAILLRELHSGEDSMVEIYAALEKVLRLCNDFPETAGLLRPVHGALFDHLRPNDEFKGARKSISMWELYPKEARVVWEKLAEHGEGSYEHCRFGHPFSKSVFTAGCPECGKEKAHFNAKDNCHVAGRIYKSEIDQAAANKAFLPRHLRK